MLGIHDEEIECNKNRGEIHMKILQDDDLMPFGQKYRGIKMENVPVNYLHWCWHEGPQFKHKVKEHPVAEYIERNLDVLKSENKDLIWS